MAPAVKRKPQADNTDSQSKATVKPTARATKKQKIDGAVAADLSPSETPAQRGRKPNASKVNGTHTQSNGAVAVAKEHVPALNGTSADMAPVAQATMAGKRRLAQDEDDGNVTHVNGGGDNAERPAKRQAVDSESGVNGVIPSADLPTPAVFTSTALDVPNTNGHRTSTTPSATSIRPTTEQVPASMQQVPSSRKPGKSKELDMRDKLYSWCIKTKPIGEIYSIEELKKADITHDDEELLHMCQLLVSHFLFSAMTLNRGVVYKTRSMDVAKKLAKLHENHILIYCLIENMGGQGQWLRPLEMRSHLHQSVVRKCLKELLSVKAITEIKSADTTRKVYISADVQPDAKHIGGGFMDEGKFDVGAIEVLSAVAIEYIEENSWFKADPPPSEARTSSHKSSKHRKDKDQPVISIDSGVRHDDDNDTPENVTKSTPKKERTLYPPWINRKDKKLLIPHHPNHYNQYPTTIDTMLHLNETKVLKGIVLTLQDTDQLLTKLHFDGYIERMRDPRGELNMKEPRWRTTRRVWRMNTMHEVAQHFGGVEPVGGELLPGNGLSQVPCLRCPVKRKCKSGGLVNPEECKYLAEWLEF